MFCEMVDYECVVFAQVPSIPYRVLSNHGIKGPKPLPIVGNYLSIRKVIYIL